MTLEQVAGALGMSHSQISRLERGNSMLTEKTMNALSELYGKKPWELAGRDRTEEGPRSEGSAAAAVRGCSLSVNPDAVAEAERYVALASPINAAPKDIVRHLFVNILGLAMEGGDAGQD